MLIRFSISHTKQQQVLSLFSGKYRSKTHTSRRIEADLAPWEITLCWHLWEHLGDGNHFNFHIHTIYYHYRGSGWQILMSQIRWNTVSCLTCIIVRFLSEGRILVLLVTDDINHWYLRLWRTNSWRMGHSWHCPHYLRLYLITTRVLESVCQ